MSSYHYITTNQSGLNTGTGDTTIEAQGVVVTGGIDMRYQGDDTTFDGGGNQTVDISGGILGSIDDYSGASSGNDSITITPTGYIDYYWFGAINLAGGGNTVVNEGSIVATNYASAILITGSAGADQGYTNTIQNTGTLSGSETIGRTGDGVVEVSGPQAVDIDNSGSILAGAGAIGIYLSSSAGGNSILNSGLITGGMTLNTDGIAVTNSGTIEGSISVYGGNWLSNSGTITGNLAFSGTAPRVYNHGSMNGIVMTGGVGSEFHNYGAIDGLVQLSDGVTIATNSGTISGPVSIGNAAGASFINAGTINGNVTLGSGANETFDSTDGRVNGRVSAGAGGDVITGGISTTSLFGGSGADVLSANPHQAATSRTNLLGGGGHDILYAGPGQDFFYFSSDAASSSDSIKGFNATSDRFVFHHSAFTKLTAGATPAFSTAAAATSATDYLFYNSSSGNLYYDPDGSGKGSPFLLANVGAGLHLAASNFVVFA
jgi:hypothetical protein